jgi:hypothetical protein
MLRRLARGETMRDGRRLCGRRRLRSSPLVLDHRRVHLLELDLLRPRSHPHQPYELLFSQPISGRHRPRLSDHRLHHRSEYDLDAQRRRRPPVVHRWRWQSLAPQHRLRQPLPRLHHGTEPFGRARYGAQPHDLHVEQRDPRQRRYATPLLHGPSVPGCRDTSDPHLSRR